MSHLPRMQPLAFTFCLLFPGEINTAAEAQTSLYEGKRKGEKVNLRFDLTPLSYFPVCPFPCVLGPCFSLLRK